MTSKLGKKLMSLSAYAALAGGALLLSARGASAANCDWEIGGSTSVNSLSCSCNASTGTVNDFGTSHHYLIVNHTGGPGYVEGLGWPGPNGSLTIVSDSGVNDGSSGTNQPQDYLVIGCRAEDNGIIVQ